MVARGQLTNPMNIMLMIVAVLSFVVGQIPTGIFVLGLVTFNVVMASSQELKAQASVEALAHLQVPHARVRRGGAGRRSSRRSSCRATSCCSRLVTSCPLTGAS